MSGFKAFYRGLLGVALSTVALVSAHNVAAQSIVAPPTVTAVDHNGVNLTTGKYQLPNLDIAIGGSGSGLSRSTLSFLNDTTSLNGTADNYSGRADTAAPPAGITGFTYNVSYAGKVYRFIFKTDSNGALLPGPYVPTDGGPERLDCTDPNPSSTTGTCTLTLSDATIVVYDRSVGTHLSQITRPDGEVVNITYYTVSNAAKAIKSISSSLGWMLKYQVDASYKVTRVTGINTAQVYCDPAASSCSVDNSYPYAALSVSGSTTSIVRNGTTAGTTTAIVSYTTSGDVTTITSPSGVTKTVTLYPTGNTNVGKVWKVQIGTSLWTYTYTTSGSGIETVVTAPNGTTRKMFFNTVIAKITSQTDEAGRVVTYGYNTTVGDANYGRLTKVVNPDGNTNTGGFTLYSYNTRGDLIGTTVVPKNGATSGSPTAGLSMVSTATYVTSCDDISVVGGNARYCHKPLTTTDTNGVTTTYTYHAASGQVQSITLPQPGTGLQKPHTFNTYQQFTPYIKNSAGALVAQPAVWRLVSTSSCMTGAAGSGTSAPACATTNDAKVSTITYDTDGSASPTPPYNNNVLPISTTTKLGDGTLAQTAAVTYNNNGQVIVSDGPKTGEVDEAYVFYDQLGRTVGTVGMDPDGTASRKRHATWSYYDSDGRVYKTETGTVATSSYGTVSASARWTNAQTDWNNTTTRVVQESDTNEFNSIGLPVIARHYIGLATGTAKDVTQRSYDAMLRLDCEAVRLNSSYYASLGSYSACSLTPAASDGSHDRITKHTYDTVSGAEISTTSAYGTGFARVDALKNYDLSTTTSPGTLSWVEDAKGNRTSYTYDDFNRLIKTCYPSTGALHTSSTSDCEVTVYRSSTLLAVAQASTLVLQVKLRDYSSNSADAITFGYDKIGRVITKSGALTETFTYDNFGQNTSHVNSSPGVIVGGTGITETFTYNALGWLISDAQPLGTVSYQYDAYGRRSRLTYPGTGLYVTYGYDDADELLRICENGANCTSSDVSLLGFTYDDYGRRTATKARKSDGTALSLGSYGFDGSLRLQTVTTPGNTVTLGYNVADQINSRTNSSSAYEPTAPVNGATTYGVDGLNRMTTSGGSSLSYDLRGNMTSDGAVTMAYNANNLLTSAGTATLLYDAGGRLKSYSKGSVTYQFVYDGADLIAEYDNAGTLLRRYVHGPGDDEPLVWYEGTGTGTPRFLIADERGSIIAVTNNAGTVLAQNAYDEYGVPYTSNATYAGRFRYTGQVWLPELSLYNYKARMYLPTIGRFLQTDPIGYGDGMNWYAYVGNDPLNASDPSGLDGQATPQSQPCQEASDTSCDSQVVVVVGHRHENFFDAYDRWANEHPGLDLAVNIGVTILCPECGEIKAVYDFVRHPSLANAAGLIPGEKLLAGGGKLVFKALKASGCGCFVEGTLVETPNGLVAIEDIKVGDIVLAYNEQTGELKAEPVTGLIRPQPKPTYALVFKGANRETDTFRATADHPWLTADHQWVHTEDLKAGDKIETATGPDLTLVTVKLSGKIEQTYNLEVEGLHTFLVGRDHLVVHNSCIGWTSKLVGDAAKALSRGAKEVKVGSRSEAEELFLRIFQGDGYKNTTGMSPTEAKDFFGSKAGTYHWDEGAGNFPHGQDHLQVHTKTGDVIRIYY